MPYKETGASPRTKPVRATVRPELYYKPSTTLDEPREISIKTMRPPCRQSENVFDLDDTSKAVKKTIRIVRKQARPPSRHKTPPKAVGLELPPDNIDFHSMDSTPISQGLSMSQPINLAMMDDKSTKNSRKLRADSVKGKPIKKTEDTGFGSRAWSAKQNGKNAPIVLNKRKSDIAPNSLGGNEIVNSPHDASKRSSSRSKQQNLPIFTNLQSEFLDLFA